MLLRANVITVVVVVAIVVVVAGYLDNQTRINYSLMGKKFIQKDANQSDGWIPVTDMIRSGIFYGIHALNGVCVQ
jgi:hypothetical protein